MERFKRQPDEQILLKGKIKLLRGEQTFKNIMFGKANMDCKAFLTSQRFVACQERQWNMLGPLFFFVALFIPKKIALEIPLEYFASVKRGESKVNRELILQASDGSECVIQLDGLLDTFVDKRSKWIETFADAVKTIEPSVEAKIDESGVEFHSERHTERPPQSAGQTPQQESASQPLIAAPPSGSKSWVKVLVVAAIVFLLIPVIGMAGYLLFRQSSRTAIENETSNANRSMRSNLAPAANATPANERGTPIANDPRASINGGILNDKAIKLPKPDYPASAKATKISGRVTVQVLIDESGKVIDAYATSSQYPLLQESAVRAARQARFSPTLVSGKPVKVSGVLTYHFVPE